MVNKKGCLIRQPFFNTNKIYYSSSSESEALLEELSVFKKRLGLRLRFIPFDMKTIKAASTQKINERTIKPVSSCANPKTVSCKVTIQYVDILNFNIEIDCITSAMIIEIPKASKTAAKRCDKINILSLSKFMLLKKMPGLIYNEILKTNTFIAKKPDAAIIQNGKILLFI
jgi:hypothetical protein